MDSDNRSNVKLLAAVTLGALSMAIHQQVEPDALFATSSMTVGATSTGTTKPPTVEETSMAVPTIKGPAPLPSEEEAAK